MKATLLYNPAAGTHRESRTAVAHHVASVLHDAGFAVQAEATYARGSAQQQSREAVRTGAEAIFACGGDGTVHDVLQGIAGSDTLLGIVPMGSANALAQELNIPPNPFRAAASFRPGSFCTLRTMVIQRARSPQQYSLCMAGAGPDGLLMYRMLAVSRSRFGRWRYYEHALRLFLTHRFDPFVIQLEQADGKRSRHIVVSAMALRVGDLGGIFAGMARGASVHDESLHVVLVAPPAKLTLPLWFVLSWLGVGRLHPGVSAVKASRMAWADSIPLQVDGEWCGRDAAEISAEGPMQRVLIPARPTQNAQG